MERDGEKACGRDGQIDGKGDGPLSWQSKSEGLGESREIERGDRVYAT